MLLAERRASRERHPVVGRASTTGGERAARAVAAAGGARQQRCRLLSMLFIYAATTTARLIDGGEGSGSDQGLVFDLGAGELRFWRFSTIATLVYAFVATPKTLRATEKQSWKQRRHCKQHKSDEQQRPLPFPPCGNSGA